MRDALSTSEVQRHTGVSYRQLDYWERTGFLVPSIRRAGGSGTQRLYSRADVRYAAAIKRLLDAGVSMQAIRRAAEGNHRSLERFANGIVDAINGFLDELRERD